jgi:hypothetical protein
MDTVKLEKEKIINNYLSSIDLSENNIDINKIKSDLKTLLQEEPAVTLNNKTEEMITEQGKEPKIVTSLESMSIIYTYERTIAGTTLPIPVKLTFQID